MAMGERAAAFSPLTSVYSKVILLGPFFQESRIKTSPHLLVSFRTKKGWSETRDLAIENFNEYTHGPWRYEKLRYCDFERYLARQLSLQVKGKEFSEIKELKVFRELNQYLTHETISSSVDSIRLEYCLSTYIPVGNTVRLDTIFSFAYNPNDIAVAKKY